MLVAVVQLDEPAVQLEEHRSELFLVTRSVCYGPERVKVGQAGEKESSSDAKR